MNLSIITTHYHPISFLKESLENNYSLFKKENIKFNHYLIDNNFPLEEKQGEKIKILCEKYNIKYLNAEKNLGNIGAIKYFHDYMKPKDIVLHIESDVYLLSEETLTSIINLHKNENIENLIYLNNKNLKDYDKKIYKINDINVFDLEIKNLNHTWVQCFNYNINCHQKINTVIKNDQRNNYDVVGEKSDDFKKINLPFLIMNDVYEDMEKFRFQTYFEYEYYKAFAYYWSKFEKEYENLIFENFIKNYDYYFEMEDKFIACHKNFVIRAKNYVIKPKFYFEKTKIKFNKININYFLEKKSLNHEKRNEVVNKIKVKNFL